MRRSYVDRYRVSLLIGGVTATFWKAGPWQWPRLVRNGDGWHAVAGPFEFYRPSRRVRA